MVRSRATLALVTLIAGVLAADTALARGSSGRSRGTRSGITHHHHHHAHVGVVAGAVVLAPAVWPGWYYPPYVSPAAPLYYIEHPDRAGGEWLYCRATNAYSRTWGNA